MDVYVVTPQLSPLITSGVYHYCVKYHGLERVSSITFHGSSCARDMKHASRTKTPLHRGTAAIPFLCLSHEKVSTPFKWFVR